MLCNVHPLPPQYDITGMVRGVLGAVLNWVHMIAENRYILSDRYTSDGCCFAVWLAVFIKCSSIVEIYEITETEVGLVANHTEKCAYTFSI